jgi:hypothetical protein
MLNGGCGGAFGLQRDARAGEELVGSYRYQVHLLHWLESNNYGVSLSDNDLYIKVKRMVYLSDRSDFKAGRNYCVAQLLEDLVDRGWICGGAIWW